MRGNIPPHFFHCGTGAEININAGCLLRSTKELLDKGKVNLTPVRVAHLRRKGAKKSLDYKVNLGDFAALRETRF
jgi:hypothetical protein